MKHSIRRSVLALTVGAACTSAAWATAPLRHLALKRAEPAADSTVTAAPTQLALYFTAKPTLRLSSVTLTGPKGAVTLAPLTLDSTKGAPLVAKITGTIAEGAQLVTWRTASADGHAITGKYSFTYSPRATR